MLSYEIQQIYNLFQGLVKIMLKKGFIIIYNQMIRKTTKLPKFCKYLTEKSVANFSWDKNRKLKVLQHPSQVSKLVFNEQGLCKVYDYKEGEYTLRKIVRYVTGLTFINGILFGLESATPIFGKINLISFGLATGLGYFMLAFLHIYSKRIVHRIYLKNDFQTIQVQFFNAFWKQQTMSFNISQFQEPCPGFADFTRFELTRMGKIWINLNKNQFKNVPDYEQTLNHILLGKPLGNLNLIRLKRRS